MPYDQLASGAIIYTYVGGNPVNAVDPLGLQSETQKYSVPSPWFNPLPFGSPQNKYWAKKLDNLCDRMFSEANDGAQPNERDLTKVKERDGNKVAEKAGYEDAHDAKDMRGEGGVDIYRDKTTGEYWLWNGIKGGEKEKL